MRNKTFIILASFAILLCTAANFSLRLFFDKFQIFLYLWMQYKLSHLPLVIKIMLPLIYEVLKFSSKYFWDGR